MNFSANRGPAGTVIYACFLFVIVFLSPSLFADNEILKPSATTVIIREHPKTGKPYASIAKSGFENENPLPSGKKISIRPDYRMLDPKVKSGEIPYEGPTSDRRKVYAFAAGLAALGTAGGVIAATALPATTASAGATGGAGVFAGAGVAVTAGTAGAVHLASKEDPKKPEDFKHEFRSEEILHPTRSESEKI